MERVNSFMYVGDCMLIDCPAGKRLRACAERWEWGRKQILDDDSISLQKKRIEGQWPQKATMLGFEINKDDMAVQLHAAKIQQARTLVLGKELAPENYGVTVKTLQHLRGLRAHWLTCNLFRRCLCHMIRLDEW